MELRPDQIREFDVYMADGQRQLILAQGLTLGQKVHDGESQILGIDICDALEGIWNQAANESALDILAALASDKSIKPSEVATALVHKYAHMMLCLGFRFAMELFEIPLQGGPVTGKGVDNGEV